MPQASHLSTTSSLADSMEMTSGCDSASLYAWLDLDASDSGFEIGQDALANRFHLAERPVAWAPYYSTDGEAAPIVGVTETLKIADGTAHEQLSFSSLQDLVNTDAVIAELSAVDKEWVTYSPSIPDTTGSHTGPNFGVSHPAHVADDVNATLAFMFKEATAAST
jgi:hypothetical protein